MRSIDKRLIPVVAALLAMSLGACATNKYLYKEAAYVAPTPPAANETLVYVFREDSGFGGALKFDIIVNETVMAVLAPGTFSYFKILSGSNEIVAYAVRPQMHFRVIGRSGETVYLLCRMGYTTGIFIEELTEDRAAELRTRYKYAEIGLKGQTVDTNYKTFYDKLYQ